VGIKKHPIQFKHKGWVIQMSQLAKKSSSTSLGEIENTATDTETAVLSYISDLKQNLPIILM
jgi:hypothetical protein